MEREISFWIGPNNVVVELGGDPTREELEAVVQAVARRLSVTDLVRGTDLDPFGTWKGVRDVGAPE